ncbi:MAG: FHA domain-containing protein [Myxococcota bacterium]|nr:FHA domain-containing protein [Myxococcota bacterium]
MPVKIQILDKRETGPLVTFRSQVIRIGRDRGCEIVFDDPSVSRVHCAIHAQAARAVLVVGHSRNPTHVNGEKVSNVELKAGDEITVCDYKLRFDPDLSRPEQTGPRTLDYRASRGAGARSAPDPLAPGPAMPEISLDGLDDDDEDSLDLVPNAPLEPADDLEDPGRPDDQHTQVLPRGRSKESAPAAPQLLGSPVAQPAAASGAAQLGVPGRGDDEHTRVLPGCAPAPVAQPGPSQAVILTDPSKPAQDQAELDELDPRRLSVAIQEATDGMADGVTARQKSKKSPLQSNGVRAAMLLVMLLLALWAWKDAIVPGAGTAGTATYDRGEAGGSSAPVIVGDRAGRSDAELRADAQKYLDVGSKKLEEHHLQDGNLTQAIQQLRNSNATLQLLGEPGSLVADVEAKLREAEDLRDQKHRDALFHYQKLKRAGNYREGQEELGFIMRLIDDETDERFQYAARELAQIEQAMKDARR